MKRITSIIILLALALTVSAEDTKTGVALQNQHKVVMEARRSDMNFNEIDVVGAIRVIIEERTAGNIIVRAPQSVVPYVLLSVEDGTLHASLLKGVPVSRSSDIIAEVYIPNNGKINDIEAAASAHIIVKPTLLANELDIEAIGASHIEFKSHSREISIDAAGASTINADVATAELDIDLSGASTLKIKGSATNGDLEVAGASTILAQELLVAALDVECIGASKARVCATNCNAEATGASSIDVECHTLLNASAAGASAITYSGECKVNPISNTGASSIRKK